MNVRLGLRLVTLAILAGLAMAPGCFCGGHDVLTGDPCTRDRECIPGDICYSGTCVGDGVLRFTLTWSTTVDFDLHVVTPTGTEIYYAATSADGGMLDVDDCVGESCSDPAGTHVENIVFTDSAPAGEYMVWVENYDGADGGDFTIDVSTGDLFSGTLTATAGETSNTFMVNF
jgi:uncharacterized protein YfaP (DUF2135 family)